MRFDPEPLAKRITEFQVVELQPGGFLGAVGFQILERQGLIHSEGFTDFSLAEAARPLLWDRVNALAQNQGLLRIWTREEAPFWSRCGLGPPDPEALTHLPAQWRMEPGRLLTVKLKDDLDAILAADAQFALFMQNERQRSQRTLRRAKMMKAFAGLLAAVLFFVVAGAAFMLVRRYLLPPSG